MFLILNRNVDKIKTIDNDKKNLMKSIPFLDTSDEVEKAFCALNNTKNKAIMGNSLFNINLLL